MAIEPFGFWNSNSYEFECDLILRPNINILSYAYGGQCNQIIAKPKYPFYYISFFSISTILWINKLNLPHYLDAYTRDLLKAQEVYLIPSVDTICQLLDKVSHDLNSLILLVD